MMRQYELVDRVLKYDPSADEALLNRAYVYAMKAHGHQKRASGDPYFSHPLEVAAILTDLKLDDATISAALLHDVIEDTDVTRAEIDQMFGKEIGALVDGLTKIKKLDLVTKKAEQAENFRKLLVAISSDIRVLLIKLADRLHNMRTLEHMRPESRRRVSEETLEIYAPLAGRMGMQGMREELEALAFKWGIPTAYQAVIDKLDDIHKRNAGLVEEISSRIEEQARRSRARRRRCTAARRSPSRSGARWRTGRSPSSSCPTSTASASWCAISTPATARSASCTPPGARCRAASRTTSRPEAEQLPVDPHHHRRPAPSARRVADPHGRDASRRRVRRGRAFALQGRPRSRRKRCRRQRQRDGCPVQGKPVHLAAAPGRHPAGRRQPGGIPRAHQARAVPGSGVLLHAQGAPDRAAEWRHADRLRLCRAHRRRQFLRRRCDQRPPAAAHHPAQERR